MADWEGKNLLCFGDNLEFLSDPTLFPDECIDLIYLDPPFNSQANYNVLFKEASGIPSAARIRAFEDTWTWDMAANEALTRIHNDPAVPAPLIELMKTFMNFLKASPMMAYLVRMSIRLAHMHRILKSTGSLYLHCDPTASHYLKLLLDAIFGLGQLQNEIIWAYKSGGATRRRFARKHDILLFYGKDVRLCKFNPQQQKSYNRGLKPYRFKGVKEYQDDVGWYTLVNMRDVWSIDMVGRTSAERLGYPTQKPLELLKRIVSASSNPGDVILDPFCGCGTTTDAVETINRENPGQQPRTWIGIDITHLSINLIKHRLTRFNPLPEYEVIGEPAGLGGAEALAQQDPFQFQFWALGLIGARPVGGKKKKGADLGIDGVRYFLDEMKGSQPVTKTMLVQVNSGKVGSRDIRDFIGTLSRKKAEMGVFVTLQGLTGLMKAEAATAGTYTSLWDNKTYPKVQILTIEELLKDPYRPDPRCLAIPGGVTQHTFSAPAKHKAERTRQGRMFPDET